MLQNVWIWKQDCPIWHFQKSMTQKHVSAFCLCWHLPLALFSFAYLGMMGFKSQCALLGNSASQMITFDLMSKNLADLFNSFASFTFDFVFVYIWRNISNLSGKTKTCLISWKNQYILWATSSKRVFFCVELLNGTQALKICCLFKVWVLWGCFQ